MISNEKVALKNEAFLENFRNNFLLATTIFVSQKIKPQIDFLALLVGTEKVLSMMKTKTCKKLAIGICFMV